jgi:hypothetical protein
MRDGFFKEKLEWGAGAAGGGGKAAIATAPLPPRSVLHTQKQAKIGTVSKTACRFGPEDLVKTKVVIIACKKSMGRALQIF